MDLSQREGNYPVPPSAPKTLGVEFSGTIESFGSASATGGFAVGDAVFGLAYGGAYAEYVEANTHILLRKPEALSWEQAAGIPEAWMTATQALHFIGEMAKGKRVLWHAGASGVSIAGIQLAADAGASAVYATAGTDEKCAFITGELGATAAFNYRKGDWADELLKATEGKGVDLIVDYIGAPYLAQNLRAAAMDARIVQLAFMGGAVLQGVDYSSLLRKRIRLEGSSLRSRDPAYQGRLTDKLREYMPDFENGRLKVLIDKVFPWTEVQKAHEAMEANSTKGKIICTIP